VDPKTPKSGRLTKESNFYKRKYEKKVNVYWQKVHNTFYSSRMSFLFE